MAKMTQKMRRTLEVLEPMSHGIDSGMTCAEVVGSGGTQSCLYTAVKKQWAAKESYRQGFYSDNPNAAPRYYRTAAGTAALEETDN
jgi:hypothetical protein